MYLHSWVPFSSRAELQQLHMQVPRGVCVHLHTTHTSRGAFAPGSSCRQREPAWRPWLRCIGAVHEVATRRARCLHAMAPIATACTS